MKPQARAWLFVYGTLQPSVGTAMGAWIAARLVRAEPASAPGRLHAIEDGRGWFPALVAPKSQARVRGTLCELRLKPGERARLDHYEGKEYRRSVLPVRTACGRRRSAQAYVWRIGVPSGSPVIGGGDFLRWLRLHRRTAYTTRRTTIRPTEQAQEGTVFGAKDMMLQALQMGLANGNAID